ncbi:MAG: Ig-like domain-containing protein [Prevotellaceae bacterium]|jgi:hypothetical protein|nr:Ig-like domain-containing protein [Prevotellaceae bacterium]
MKRLMYSLIAAAVLFSCGEKTKTKLEGLQIVPASHTFNSIRETKQLTAVGTPADFDLSTVQLTWSSSNDSVVSVNNKGLVTAVDYGTAVITATAEGFTATCNVKVQTYVEALEFTKVVPLAFDHIMDLIDTRVRSDGSVDSVFRMELIALGQGMDFIDNKGVVGQGVFAIINIPFWGNYKDGEMQAASLVGVPFIAADTMITTYDEFWAFGTVPDRFNDGLPFVKGTINLDAINAGELLSDNVIGATLWYPADEGWYYYGIITAQEFQLDWKEEDELPTMEYYDLTGQILIYPFTDGTHGDVTMQYFVEQDQGEDFILAPIHWVKEASAPPASASAPAKVASKSPAVKINKQYLKKVAPRDWSKARVLDKKSFVKYLK